MKALRFHDAARLELLSEVSYYSTISPLLAQRLAGAVEEAVALARSFPEIGVPYLQQTRRVFPKKFPFSIVYVEADSEIYIVAFAPFRRKPGYWRARIEEDDG